MPTCFVIMPITTPAHHVERDGGDQDHFLHVLEHLFTPALEAAGYDAISPVASGSDLIQAEIIRNLDEADLALCDMTTLNANVFFELGIRTALNKPVATVRDAFTKRIPFDHSMVNCFEYRWQMDTWIVKEEIPRLAAHIRACVERGGETNTLWKRLGIEAGARVGSAGTTHAYRAADGEALLIDMRDTGLTSDREEAVVRAVRDSGVRVLFSNELNGGQLLEEAGLRGWRREEAETLLATLPSPEPPGHRVVGDFFREVSIDGGLVRGHDEAGTVPGSETQETIPR